MARVWKPLPLHDVIKAATVEWVHEVSKIPHFFFRLFKCIIRVFKVNFFFLEFSCLVQIPTLAVLATWMRVLFGTHQSEYRFNWFTEKNRFKRTIRTSLSYSQFPSRERRRTSSAYLQAQSSLHHWPTRRHRTRICDRRVVLLSHHVFTIVCNDERDLRRCFAAAGPQIDG